MSKLLIGICVMDKDLDFFGYLHAVKVATVRQINRDIYQYKRITTLYDRLRQFEKRGWLSRQADPRYPRNKIVTLTRRGFNKFVKNGREAIIELRSDSVSHDLLLNDIRRAFLDCFKVTAFHTENMLQSQPDYRLSDDYGAFVDLRSDAVVDVKFQHGNMSMAIEFEASLKSVIRTKEIVGRYYGEEMIPAVLCIYQSVEIKELYVWLEKEHFAKEAPKFFYASINDVVGQVSLSLVDRDNRVLRIDRSLSEGISTPVMEQ